MSPRWRRRRQAAYQVLDGRAVVLVAPRRTVHRLDEVATAVWQLLERQPTLDELVSAIGEQFDAPLETIRRDIAELLVRMEELEMIERV